MWQRAFVLTLLFQAASWARLQDQVFHADVELVQLDAQVVQKNTRRSVGSLTKDDFELYENGVKQTIAQLSRGQIPLSIVLLFDLTDSVRPVLKPLAAGALAALQHLKPEDEVSVMIYGESARLLQDFTTNRALAVAAIEKASDMKSSEEAFFNESIFQASEQLSKSTNPQGRHAIVWLTDNVPNIPSTSVHTQEQAVQEAHKTGTVVSTLLERSGLSDFMDVFMKPASWAVQGSSRTPGNVYTYADETGGDVLKSNKEDVGTKLAELLDEIRTQYTLGYYPLTSVPKGTFCRIKLVVRPGIRKREGKLMVRTRSGYYR